MKDHWKLYKAHMIDGKCICWGGTIECEAKPCEREKIVKFRKKEGL
jgi:hypothetical protein